MKILIVAATSGEVQPLLKHLRSNFEQHSDYHFQKNKTAISILITGVGVVATTFALTCALHADSYDFVINLGVAGSLDKDVQPGAVVHVTEESFADLGAEERDGSYKDVFELGLADANKPPFDGGILKNSAAAEYDFLKKVKGITVNKVHGASFSIARLKSKYPDAQVESMEGAAVFYVCTQFNVAFIEIRSISNRVEPRDKSKWQLSVAIANLNDTAMKLLETIV